VNWLHHRLCGSRAWQTRVAGDLLPWALSGVSLGDDVLEIGPGAGAVTANLVSRVPRLTCVEIDPTLAERLTRRFAAPNVSVRCEDATRLSAADDSFDTVLCLMVLHHVSPAARQEHVFAEARRVLRPGGTLVMLESRPGLLMTALHVGDTHVPIDPQTIDTRLLRAGLHDVDVDLRPRAVRVLARRRS
jgi:ubiquinone/menaquinone biosynthesis C-methylase UbiE